MVAYTVFAALDRRTLGVAHSKWLLAEQWLPSVLAQALRVLRRFSAHPLNTVRLERPRSLDPG